MGILWIMMVNADGLVDEWTSTSRMYNMMGLISEKGEISRYPLAFRYQWDPTCDLDDNNDGMRSKNQGISIKPYWYLPG